MSNYWLHRLNHEHGLEILDQEQLLTIGFSDCANHSEMVAAIQDKDKNQTFDQIYEEIYNGDIWRSRYSLWRFTCEMSVGDVIIVPRPRGFSICELTEGPLVSQKRMHCDIGFEWKVKMLTTVLSPREDYAPANLLSRMKCRQTTLEISDLAEEIKIALARYNSRRPFALSKDLTEKCYTILASYSSPDHLERLVQDYFTRLGAKSEILPRNYPGKEGDCDVSAIFPALRLTISVQVKRHQGVTGIDAVEQIVNFAKANKPEEKNWSYIVWVISLAEDFSDEAKDLAKNEGVVLLNGKDFCSLLIANGIGV